MALPFGLIGDDTLLCWWPSSLAKARKTGCITKAMVLWVQRPQHWVHRSQGAFSLYQMRKELDKTGELVKYSPGTCEPSSLNCKDKKGHLRLYWSSGDLRNKGNENLRELGNNWTSRPPKDGKLVEEMEGELYSQLELWLGINVTTWPRGWLITFCLLCSVFLSAEQYFHFCLSFWGESDWVEPLYYWTAYRRAALRLHGHCEPLSSVQWRDHVVQNMATCASRTT